MGPKSVWNKKVMGPNSDGTKCVWGPNIMLPKSDEAKKCLGPKWDGAKMCQGPKCEGAKMCLGPKCDGAKMCLVVLGTKLRWGQSVSGDKMFEPKGVRPKLAGPNCEAAVNPKQALLKRIGNSSAFLKHTKVPSVDKNRHF